MTQDRFSDTGRWLGYINEAPKEALEAPRSVAAEVAFFEAVKAGRDELIKHPFMAAPAPISLFLGECPRESRALLFRACHLTAAGQYEAGSLAILTFIRSVAQRYQDDIDAGGPDLFGSDK